MKSKKLSKNLLLISMICMILSSSAFMVFPDASEKSLEGSDTLLILSGLLFWIPLLAAYTMLFIVNIKRKKDRFVVENRTRKIGIINFFSNIYAVVAEGIFAISFVVLLILALTKYEGFLMYFCIGLCVLAIQLHGVFNGINFKYVTSRKEKIKAKNKAISDTANEELAKDNTDEDSTEAYNFMQYDINEEENLSSSEDAEKDDEEFSETIKSDVSSSDINKKETE